MITCPACGCKCYEGTSTCPHCGDKIGSEFNALHDENSHIDVVKTAIPTSQAIFCTQCGAQNPSEAEFCCKCGNRILKGGPHQTVDTHSSMTVNSLLGTIVNEISDVAGVERLEKGSSKRMFSEVFKKRTPDELEAYFSVGTPGTTPTLDKIDTSWPRPWAFVKTFLGSIVLFAGLYYMASYFQNLMSIPALVMVGSFAVPGSILVLFFEINIPRNLSLYQLVRLSFLGGVIALVACLFLYRWVEKIGLNEMGAAVAGIVEEPAKLLAMLIVANNARYRWTLNGLLIGACVGTGFSVVETAGNAFLDLLNGGHLAMVETLFLRAAFYPLGGHALLSAIVGASVWRVKRERRFEWSMLINRRFLRPFIIAATLHAIWNSPFQLPYFGKYLVVGFVAWLIIISLMQSGLKEIRTAQATANAVSQTSDTRMDTALTPAPT